MRFGSSINAECFHRFMLWLGIALAFLIYTLGVFTWGAFLVGLPIAAILTGSYFWIRLDVWRSDETIEELSNLRGSVDFLKKDLISRRVDSRAAIVWLLVATAAQACFPTEHGNPLIFIDVLLLIIPITNRIVELAKERQFDRLRVSR